MIISVFGASNPSDDLYDLAYKLGRYLGEKGHTVKNGGYGGTMEASAKGCQKVRGHTIGVCVEGHKIDKMGHPNNYLNDVKIMPDVQHRITELLNADRIVVVKGNIGTLEWVVQDNITQFVLLESVGANSEVTL